MLNALTIAAEGQKADIVKPFKDAGAGVMEIALKHDKNAYRIIYALKLGDDIYVIHAWQKKSPKGIKTAQKDVNLIKERIKKLKEQLK